MATGTFLCRWSHWPSERSTLPSVIEEPPILLAHTVVCYLYIIRSVLWSVREMSWWLITSLNILLSAHAPLWVSFCSPYLFYLLTVGVQVVYFSLDHTQTHTTVGRTPLDGGSAHRNTNIHKRQISMSPVGFEPTIPASARPQTYTLDRVATGIGAFVWAYMYFCMYPMFKWCYSRSFYSVQHDKVILALWRNVPPAYSWWMNLVQADDELNSVPWNGTCITTSKQSYYPTLCENPKNHHLNNKRHDIWGHIYIYMRHYV
jgi:hypothetical protein